MKWTFIRDSYLEWYSGLLRIRMFIPGIQLAEGWWLDSELTEFQLFEIADLAVEELQADCPVGEALVGWPVAKNPRRLILARYNQRCEMYVAI